MNEVEEKIKELKAKHPLTRDDISELLSLVGRPGQKQQEKIDAIKELNKSNFQGVQLEKTLDSYQTF